MAFYEHGRKSPLLLGSEERIKKHGRGELAIEETCLVHCAADWLQNVSLASHTSLAKRGVYAIVNILLTAFHVISWAEKNT